MADYTPLICKKCGHYGEPGDEEDHLVDVLCQYCGHTWEMDVG